MKTKLIAALSIICLLAAGTNLLFAWGAWGHKHINRASVFALPDGMRKFFYNHIDFITEGSVVPDLRRGILNDKGESPRHYIDIEDFKGVALIDFPKTTQEVYTKYDSTFLNKTGYLPWYIQNLEEKLTAAFKKRNKSEILFISAELGHYVADAHMPLHTSSNYNGQFTNQKGIHALWETQIPELLGDAYNFKTHDAKYIADIPSETWNIITLSHSLADTLLSIERQTRKMFEGNIYKKDAAGKNVLYYNQPEFSDAYVKKFSEAMNGMVENQLRLSIQDVANYWYTAWVNGGSPDILSLDDEHLTRQNTKNYKLEYKAWTKGKLLNLSRDKE